ncbi:DUF2975 domain-containing protein [Streptomyces sp. NPDC091292]|uniref:DUF2975 domain-containing protein n=1 Tax=Streptomyces sp. NPDC091292 TaxID=3365991 RepID=UPI003815E3F8
MNTRLTRMLASVAWGLAVLCGLFVIGVGVSHGVDDGAVCVETGFWANASVADETPVGKGVEASSSATRLCQHSPSVGQRAAELGGRLPWPLFSSLALLLFSRLLKGVMEDGPFTDTVARRLTVLGWFVTLGTPLAGLVVGWSQSWLVGSMAPLVGSGPAITGPTAPLILAGLAAVVMGKIMQQGVRMREDLEGTI